MPENIQIIIIRCSPELFKTPYTSEDDITPEKTTTGAMHKNVIQLGIFGSASITIKIINVINAQSIVEPISFPP
jgi:hypothetical protein